MVTFDNEETKKLIRDRGWASKCTTAAFAICLCIGVVAACLSANVDKYYKVMFGLLGSLIAGVVLTIVLFIITKVRESRIGEEVKRTLATAMQGNSELFSPDSEIALVATYSGDNLTLSRQNTCREVTFDLSGVKKVPKIYSNFGTCLVEYIEGYFALHTAEGCQSVTIADKIGGRTDVIQIVACGKPCREDDKNYFILRGLIK